jgi:hypothetical protein
LTTMDEGAWTWHIADETDEIAIEPTSAAPSTVAHPLRKFDIRAKALLLTEKEKNSTTF